MNKTIEAQIPARKMSWGGQTKTFPPRVDLFQQDDSGQWSLDGELLTEAEVIDICQRATNWDGIRLAHFRMYGFHA